MLFIRTYEIINSITSNHLLKLNPSPNAIPKSTRKPNLSLQSSLHCSIKPSPFPEFQRTLRSTQSPLTSVNIPIYLNTIFPLPSPNKLSLKPLNPPFSFEKRNISTSSVASSIKRWQTVLSFLKIVSEIHPYPIFLKIIKRSVYNFFSLKKLSI